MGLDMYLSADFYVGGWDHDDDVQKARFAAMLEAAQIDPKLCAPESRMAYVRLNVGYWRKANQVHRWFVENTQEGVDECQLTPVSKAQLRALREQCKAALLDKSNAGDLMPAQSGFFFGPTDVDEWFFVDLEHTVEIIDRCLAAEGVSDFHYRSSW